MGELDLYRRRIDEVDQNLVKLFERRMALSTLVARYKQANGLAVWQPEREQELLQHVRSLLRDPTNADSLTEFFQALMDIGKKRQLREMAALGTEPLPAPENEYSEIVGTVGFPGVPGSFSEEAALKLFGQEAPRQACPEFDDVCVSLERGAISRGVLPIENSTTGAIGPVYDLLSRYGFVITAETYVKVEQHLLGLPEATLDDIREVYSHAQGLEQSAVFLRQYPGWTLIPHHNTSTSAKFVRDSGDKSKAAIASSRAAELYGLNLLAPHINSNNRNHTRFIAVARPKDAPLPDLTRPGKISVLFRLDHRAGSLFAALESFARYGLNLLKIESRPMPADLWQYCFYVDFAGHPADPAVTDALAHLRGHCSELRILGAYAQAEM